MSNWRFSLAVVHAVATISLVEKVYNQSLEIAHLKEQNKLERERALTFHQILQEVHDYLEDHEYDEAHEFLHSRIDHHSNFFIVAQNAL